MAVRTTPRSDAQGKSAKPKDAPKTQPKRAAQRKRGFFRRFWWVFVAVPLILLIGIIVTFIYVYSRLELPEAPPAAQTSYVSDRDGEPITALHAEFDRTEIPFSAIPLTMRQAVIAAEDKDFYEHGGISLAGIARAAWQDLVNAEVQQGGSTITQQYVKNVYTGGERSIFRKIKEAMLALKLEKKYSKNEILTKYLNTIYFGNGAYGVQAAAQTYFRVDAKDLSILQSATLAGLIAAPEAYDPVENEEGALARRNYVLDRMAEDGYITRVKARELRGMPLKLPPHENDPSPAAYFMDYTRKWLLDRYGEQMVYGGGLRVETTLDLDLQHAAERIVHQHLPLKNDPRAALVAIDPRDGGIVAMVGGPNPNKLTNDQNLAVGRGRPAGSAFKVFTLAAAIEQRFSLQSYWDGPSEITIDDRRCYTEDPETGEFGPWTLSNYEDASAGTQSLLDATANSVNTIYVQVETRLANGPADVGEIAHRMGVRSELSPVCSITLGTQDVTPLEMTQAYATVANRGMYHEAVPVSEVNLSDGSEFDRIVGEHHRVLRQNDADLVTYALQRVVLYGTGTAAALDDRPVAGKTGTGRNYTDAWFCGYVPQLAACVWVGHELPKPMENVHGLEGVTGGSIPAAIWHDFMGVATDGLKPVEFPEPDFEGYDRGAETDPGSGDDGDVEATPTPTETPTPEPTETPTPEPDPTEEPSPTEEPTTEPTETPSEEPTDEPSPDPTDEPSPTDEPTTPPPEETTPPPDDSPSPDDSPKDGGGGGGEDASPSPKG